MWDTTAFWDGFAAKYAARSISDPAAYEATLERVRAYLSPEDHVLELGCGTGSIALRLAPCVASYRGTDISGQMIAIASGKIAEDAPEGLGFVRAEVEAAPAGRQYDAILGFNLLHLLPEPEAVIARMHAALEPDGYLITKTPCLKGRGFHLRVIIGLLHLVGRAPRMRFLGTGELEAMIRNAGFEIIETAGLPRKLPNHFIVARRA